MFKRLKQFFLLQVTACWWDAELLARCRLCRQLLIRSTSSSSSAAAAAQTHWHTASETRRPEQRRRWRPRV